LRKKTQKNQSAQKRNGQIEVRPITKGQEIYKGSIEKNTITICNGLAGTGKSFVAVGMALKLFFDNECYERIVLVRPAVESGGETLGYLPGDLNEKMRPYLAPIHDNLKYFLKNKEQRGKLTNNGSSIFDVIPLAYMRGRTLSQCVVIFDEAQNATVEQMKLFLTRIGEEVKVIIEGDLQQSDIGGRNGLYDAMGRLKGISDIGIVHMGIEDVVRSRLVKKILDRYKAP
jgi:phosphate starvation-inducible PhoH-like protein